MSSEPQTSPTRYRMVVHGPPGVEIQVLNNDFLRLAGGTEKVTLRAPAGLYAVRWHAFDIGREEIVRLAPSPETLHVRFNDVGAEASAAPPTRASAALAQLNARRRTLGAEIVIVELSDSGAPSPELSKGVRLFDDDDVAMRSDASGLEAAQQEMGDSGEGANGLWAMRVYPVRPGVYRLRYAAQTGETIDQSVIALASRRTIVILRRGVAQNLVAQDGGFQAVAMLGVDPRRVTLLTTALRGAVKPSLTSVRLARLMLDGLADVAGVLDSHVLKRVLRVRADPLLRLYAAAHILARLQQVYATAGPNTPSRTLRLSRREDIGRWAPKVRELLETLPRDLPDVVACRWRLARLQGGSLPKEMISIPPALAHSWEWLTDIAVSGMVPFADTPGVRGATRGQTFAGPWLAWTAAGVKVGVVEQDDADASARVTASLERLNGLLRLAGKVGETVLEKTLTASGLQDIVRTQDLLSIFEQANFAARGAGSPTSTSDKALLGRLQTAIDALQWRVAPQHGRPRQIANPPIQDDPPALALPIVRFDDPHKGRFGGRARADGFELKAEFDDRENPDWVQIRLMVQASPDASASPGDRVRFYLHDTFDPDVYERRLRDDQARLSIHAFGGFTVGVWLPRQKLQLELDLAEVPGAPEAIRLW